MRSIGSAANEFSLGSSRRAELAASLLRAVFAATAARIIFNHCPGWCRKNVGAIFNDCGAG
jgi:hypothetical protein